MSLHQRFDHCSLVLLPLYPPRIHEVVETKEAGIGYPHSSHCLGNGDIMVSIMGTPDGKVREEGAGEGGEGGCHVHGPALAPARTAGGGGLLLRALMLLLLLCHSNSTTGLQLAATAG